LSAVGLDDIIFATFRILSAAVLTTTSLYVTYMLAKGCLRPVPVWLYTVVVLWVVTIFRWFVVWVRLEEQVQLADQISLWLQPITQAMYVLLTMVVFVLTYTHIRARRRHYYDFHDEGMADE
jgi:hypothetical protein